jgi:hypothetical protein
MLHPALTSILVIFTLPSHTEPEYSDWHMQMFAQPNLT